MTSLNHEAVLHQLIKVETTQREVHAMAYQMRVARFPAHRDLAGVDFAHVAHQCGCVQKAALKLSKISNERASKAPVQCKAADADPPCLGRTKESFRAKACHETVMAVFPDRFMRLEVKHQDRCSLQGAELSGLARQDCCVSASMAACEAALRFPDRLIGWQAHWHCKGKELAAAARFKRSSAACYPPLHLGVA